MVSRNAERILRRIRRTGITFEPGAIVLDIGCSEGYLLEAIRKRFGAQAIGVDVDERTIERARKNYPEVIFHRGLVQDLFDRLPKADVVIASAIVEHVIDPEGFLAQLRRLLKPGGKVFLLTPNASSIYYSLTGSWWRELLSIGEHIYLFTPESLGAAAERAGMKLHRLATDYDELTTLSFSFPKTVKAAAVIPWACYRAALKAVCIVLPRGRRGDILYASLEAKTDGNPVPN
ncbi:MAG TPA: class I SAM-dependent methyltransferase [Verrucomicrobiae bacterium]|nr:class I SAM-dependent methyltransferase [Verrucomicrobiae bacterium]